MIRSHKKRPHSNQVAHLCNSSKFILNVRKKGETLWREKGGWLNYSFLDFLWLGLRKFRILEIQRDLIGLPGLPGAWILFPAFPAKGVLTHVCLVPSVPKNQLQLWGSSLSSSVVLHVPCTWESTGRFLKISHPSHTSNQLNRMSGSGKQAPYFFILKLSRWFHGAGLWVNGWVVKSLYVNSLPTSDQVFASPALSSSRS